MGKPLTFFLNCDFKRLVKVVSSQMYSRLFLGAFVEGRELWYWLASPANHLEGDPADWTYEYQDAQSTEHGIRFHDGSRTFSSGVLHSRSTVLPNSTQERNSLSWSYTVVSKRFLEKRYFTYNTAVVISEVNESMVLTWTRMERAGSKLVNMGEITMSCTRLKNDKYKIEIDYGVLMKPPNKAHEVITREMTYIHDIVAHRQRLEAERVSKARKAAEEAQIAEALRKKAELEQRRAEAERSRAQTQRNEAEIRAGNEEQARIERAEKLRRDAEQLAQKRFEEQATEEYRRLLRSRRTGGPHDEFRLDNDLCLECGEPVVMRRNNKFGHLFFGCSGWSPKLHERKCEGARPTTCDLCHGEMHERTNAPNSNVLRCENSPECPATRPIPTHLEIHSWLKGERVNENRIRADFASRGLMPRYLDPVWDEILRDSFH
jgi:hypothetical protein